MNYLSPEERDHFKYWFNSLSYMSEHFTNTTYFIKLVGEYGVLLPTMDSYGGILSNDMNNFNLDSYFLGNISKKFLTL